MLIVGFWIVWRYYLRSKRTIYIYVIKKLESCHRKRSPDSHNSNLPFLLLLFSLSLRHEEDAPSISFSSWNLYNISLNSKMSHQRFCSLQSIRTWKRNRNPFTTFSNSFPFHQQTPLSKLGTPLPEHSFRYRKPQLESGANGVSWALWWPNELQFALVSQE